MSFKGDADMEHHGCCFQGIGEYRQYGLLSSSLHKGHSAQHGCDIYHNVLFSKQGEF